MKTFSKLLILALVIAFLTSCKEDKYHVIKEEPFLQGRGFGLNNITLSVKNMDSTRQYFSEKLGFSFGRTQKPGLGFINGTITSTIDFPNMSSIELLSISDSISASETDTLILNFLSKKEGIRMYALSSSSVDSTFRWLSSKGFAMDSIKTYQKPNTFSNQEAWDETNTQILNLRFKDSLDQEYRPDFSEFPDFPYGRMHEWESFYMMQRGYMKHPNGALGVSVIKVIVDNMKSAREEFIKMGLAEIKDTLNKYEAHFKLNLGQELWLIEPQSQLSEVLEERGPRVFGLVIEVLNLEETRLFFSDKLPEGAVEYDSISKELTVLKEYAFGVQLAFKQESESQALIAQKLQLNYGAKLDSVASDNANQLYQKYCALCHG